MHLLAGVAILLLCHCLGDTGGTLVQYPSHSCFQEDLTFVCTRATPTQPGHLVSLVISVLHYPPFDTSRLALSNAYTDPTAGTVSRNITLQAVTLSEAPALIVCLSVLWSNLSNSIIDTQIESNASIVVAPRPSAIDSIAVRLLNATAIMFVIEHEDTVHREDRLTYSIAVSPVGTTGYPVYNVSYYELPGQIFSISGLLDTCYWVSVNISNCVGATEHFSTHFILPELSNQNLTRVSLTQFCLYGYGYNATCPEPYAADFTQLNTFSFLIIRNNTVIDTITSSDVMLPTHYCFELPEDLLVYDPLYLRIYIDGVALNTVDLTIPVRDTVPPVVSTIERVLIIAVPSVIGIALLAIVLLLVVVCVSVLVKRKKYHRAY